MSYKVIDNFVDEQTRQLLYQHCIILDKRLSYLENHFPKRFDANCYGTHDDRQVVDAYSQYGDPTFDSLMLLKQKSVEQVTGLRLYPQYSYCRLYKKGNSLKKHRDRNSCEVSVTLTLGSEPQIEWPIFLRDGDETKEIVIAPGQALVYNGVEHEHWREPFTGEAQAQVFLHYTSNKDVKWDGRPELGLPNKYTR